MPAFFKINCAYSHALMQMNLVEVCCAAAIGGGTWGHGVNVPPVDFAILTLAIERCMERWANIQRCLPTPLSGSPLPLLAAAY